MLPNVGRNLKQTVDLIAIVTFGVSIEVSGCLFFRSHFQFFIISLATSGSTPAFEVKIEQNSGPSCQRAYNCCYCGYDSDFVVLRCSLSCENHCFRS